MNDGRPCTTDAFIAALIKDDDVPYGDIHHALSAWNEGAWEEALSLLMPEDREELLHPKKFLPAPFTIMIEDIAELDALDGVRDNYIPDNLTTQHQPRSQPNAYQLHPSRL